MDGARRLPYPRGLRPRQIPGAGHRAAWKAALEHGLFGVAPVILTIGAVYLLSRVHYLAYDFHYSYWVAANRLLHGLGLYGGNIPAGGIPAYVHQSLDVQRTLFVYPAPAAFLVLPFGLLPHAVADWVFTFVCIGAVLLALRVLRVRDWRVYGVAVLWPPVVSGYQNGNLSLLIVLGLALVWRWRDRAAISGLLVALMVAAKIIVWPLGLWLLATRRYVAFAYAVAGTVVFNLAAWLIVGVPQLSRYVDVMRALTQIEQSHSFNILSLALHHGVSQTAAYALAAAVACAAAVVCLIVGRRGNDRVAFAWAIAVSLLATPVIWSHYYALLIVPLALARPRLSAIWLVGFLLWIPVAEQAWILGSWQLVVGLCLVAAIFAVCSSKRPVADRSRERPHSGAPTTLAQLLRSPSYETAAARETSV